MSSMSRGIAPLKRLPLICALLCLALFLAACGEEGGGQPSSAPEQVTLADFDGFWEVHRTDEAGGKFHVLREHHFTGSRYMKLNMLETPGSPQKSQTYFNGEAALALDGKRLRLLDGGNAYQVLELVDKDSLRIEYPQAKPPFVEEARRIAEPSGGVYRSEQPEHEKIGGTWKNVEDKSFSFRFDPGAGSIEFFGGPELDPQLRSGAIPFRSAISVGSDSLVIVFFPQPKTLKGRIILVLNLSGDNALTA
ncbi:hypothetical protein LJC59_02890, partial [Desulfovibrio sp. OttesenSCG-928-A18]|nr:hypothetical protein [Desulfovibrio sp. OttesenSCG-928-A18]